ncbi:MAG: 3-methyl-2-oxobutanoate hydroxymethyltransferase [Candidatus Omnitrophota bacterium]|jgi:3-methyl-2-oxobutanoate hydroxymethyltransferase
MASPKKWTARRISALKGKEKIAAVTCYDYATARFVDASGMHLVLVGDSLGMTVLGHKSTLPVTVDDMIHHTAAVVRGTEHALVVGDMPFMSYQPGIDLTMVNAGRFLKEAGADAVKLEGGAERTELVKSVVGSGIPVMGHIGLTPQSIKDFGGFKVQGRSPEEAEKLIKDAKALEAAGVFSIVLEAIPAGLAQRITDSISIPTVGIGAGPYCDGQILVINDMLGTYDEFTPKFVKQYAQLGEEMTRAFGEYIHDVQKGTFPGPEHCYE